MSAENSQRYPLGLIETELLVIIILLSLLVFNYIIEDEAGSDNDQTIINNENDQTMMNNDEINSQNDNTQDTFFGYPFEQVR